MEEYNIIKNHQSFNQGTSAYITPLTNSLRHDYFRAEPRSVKYWLILINEMSRENFEYGMQWSNLIPNEISLDLIEEYILDPKKTIAAGRFQDDELEKLREPQRILLFYFLKKISSLKYYNERIIKEINDILTRDLFLQSPRKAVPDKGFGIIAYAPDTAVLISADLLLDAVVDEELITRKYLTTSALNGELMNLSRCVMGYPTDAPNQLQIEDQILPLDNRLYPFREKGSYDPGAGRFKFSPSLIVSSSLLFLREGLRKINLSITLTDTEEMGELDFKFKITTANGWVPIPNDAVPDSLITVEQINNSTVSIQYQIIIERDFPPIESILVPYAEEGIVAEKSCLMMYCERKTFTVEKIDLSVEVEGLEPAVIRNQLGVLDPKGSYNPFGIDAALQTVFSFSHPELTSPSLNNITLNPTWASKPKNLSSHYLAYGKTEEQFTVGISTSYKNPDAINYAVIQDGSYPLFSSGISFNPNTTGIQHRTGGANWDFEELDPLMHDVYYQLELNNQDFGMSQYPLLMTKYSIDLSVYELTKLSRKKRKEPLEVNMPYAPSMGALEINYTTEFETWENGGLENTIEIYKNEPKGYSYYDGDEVGLDDNVNGVIYLGIENLKANSTGVLYFNGRTGNARAEKAAVQWWYLADEGWLELGEIISDGTFGLIEEGLLTFTVPSNCSNTNSLMPKGTYWLKCTLHQKPEEERSINDSCRDRILTFKDSIIQLTGIHANALSIARQQEELDLSDNVSFLSKGSELKFTEGEPAQTVLLPFNTSGGVDRETELEFWARVFNRVRNKDRMVTFKDIEEIILHEFRNVSLVKCIPRSRGMNEVDVVVINQQVYGDIPYKISRFNSLTRLKKIQKEVLSLSSSFYGDTIKLKAKNPCYREVGFALYLQYEEGTIELENNVMLYEALCRFVTPWMFQVNTSPKFGCWFDYGDLLAHIQSLSYVKIVLDINMGVFVKERIEFPSEGYQFEEDEILIVGKPSSVIIVDNLTDYEQVGIGAMEIEGDFYVSDKDGRIPPENSYK